MGAQAETVVTNVARQLNDVRSVGEARAATDVARQNLAAGYRLAGTLAQAHDVSFIASMLGLDMGGATRAAAERDLQRASDDVELAAARLNGADTDAVDPQVWGQAAPAYGLAGAIAKAIAVVYGIVGASDSADAAVGDVLANLATAVRNAPGLFADNVGKAVGAVGEAAGGAVTDAVTGIVRGFWWLFLLAGVLIWLVATKKLKIPKISIPLGV